MSNNEFAPPVAGCGPPNGWRIFDFGEPAVLQTDGGSTTSNYEGEAGNKLRGVMFFWEKLDKKLKK